MEKIICGDCLEVLKDMESESVNCVMTSPPYWALRDYGTAQWKGGDEKCDHKIDVQPRIERKKQGLTGGLEYMKSQEPIYKDICGKCGAKRIDQQLGLEPTFQEYINSLCDIFDEVKRALRKDGTCWVNMGDSYMPHGGSRGNKTSAGADSLRKNYDMEEIAPKHKRDMSGLKAKCLCQIPSRFAIEMTNRGWILRNELIWYKPNCMPSSVKDRFTVDFEKIFFFTKKKKYWFETQYEPHEWLEKEKRRKNFYKKVSYNSKYSNGVGATQRFTENARSERYNKEGRNKRCVWKINTKPYAKAHFAAFPEKLVETPIKAGCPKGGTVLDPFSGAGTTGVVAKKLGRNFIGIELNPEYVKMSEDRIANTQRSMF